MAGEDIWHLIVRLEEASEGGRLLDAQVWAAILPREGICIDGYGLPPVGAYYEYEADEDSADGSVDMFVIFSPAIRHRRARRKAPLFTTSLDTALPGEDIIAVQAPLAGRAKWLAFAIAGDSPDAAMSYAATEPLARRAAALRAMAAKQDAHDDARRVLDLAKIELQAHDRAVAAMNLATGNQES